MPRTYGNAGIAGEDRVVFNLKGIGQNEQRHAPNHNEDGSPGSLPVLSA